MAARLTDEHMRQLDEDGFVIVEDFLPAAQCAAMLAAIRRMLPPWEQVRADPPATHGAHAYFPYVEPVLNRAIVHDEAIAFSQRWLGTDHIHYRPGLAMATYPGHPGGTPHIDNGNNSLLPPKPADHGHAQIIFWCYLDDVGPDQAPTRMIPNRFGDDMSKAVPFVAPAGSVCIFHNYSWHSASPYTRPDGQRYVWKIAFGRADHYWEQVHYYTHMGMNEQFRELVSGLTAEQRLLFRFPPPSDPYYTGQTLAALEKQYPGWDHEGVYRAAVNARAAH